MRDDDVPAMNTADLLQEAVRLHHEGQTGDVREDLDYHALGIIGFPSGAALEWFLDGATAMLAAVRAQERDDD